MSTQSTNQRDKALSSAEEMKGKRELEVVVTSFGYKQGPPPLANVVFDVRFLKNPYWVEELRPLTGLDTPVQEYVLQQSLAQDFLETLVTLLLKVLPHVSAHKVDHYIIALGCTGGQHRSTTLVEALGKKLRQQFPQYHVTLKHRELSAMHAQKQATEKDAPEKL